MNRVESKLARGGARLFGLLAFLGWLGGGLGFAVVWHEVGGWLALLCAWLGVPVGALLAHEFRNVK